MSKNRNRARCNKAHNNREYNILMKSDVVYCTICNRRAGAFDAYCGPMSKKSFRNWKRFRRTQY